MRFIKKLALALLALAVALPAVAESVSKERAAEVAATFFGGPAKRGPSAGLSQVKGGDGAYMAFNREGGGFVVVALNDAAPPILAYSFDGRFPQKEEMPDNMAWWFSQLEEKMKAIDGKAEQSDDVRRRWENPAPIMTKAGTRLYETASWHQSEPFNNLCPMDGDDRCVTGCVAIAGAILARYFEWPDAGEGTVPGGPPSKPGYYTYGPAYPAHALGHTYNWANMPLNWWEVDDEQEQLEVATLAYDMATMAEMSFGVEGSSASTSVLVSGLKTYMKYNKGARLEYRSGYDDDEWRQLLTDILDNCGPTLYSGRDSRYNAGHTFIMDGYDAEGRFHFNWGWGSYDCWCELGSAVPEGSPYIFDDLHQVAVDLVPDKSGSSGYTDALTFSASGDYAGITTNVTEYSRNTSFYCRVGFFGPVYCPFEGRIFIALYDKYGNHKEDIGRYYESGYPANIALNASSAYGETCRITCEIEPGDRIKARFVGQNNEGIIVAGPGCVDEIIVMEDSGGEEPDPTAGYTAAQTAASTSLSYNKATARLTLTFAHPANWTVKTSGGATVASGTAATGGDVVIDTSAYSSGTYTILVGSTEDPFSFTITK